MLCRQITIAGLVLMAFGVTQVSAQCQNSSHHGQTIAVKMVAKADSDHHKKTIVGTAAGAEKLSTLVAAVKQGKLVETLSSKGPFTVFAPVNSAFAKLPKSALASLLKDENRSQLQSILKYHVVAGRVEAKDVVKLKTAKTVLGKNLDVKVQNGQVWVGNAKVVKTDIHCSNGVVHLIDSVLIPPKGKTIVETAVGNKDFSTLVKLVKKAGLVETLNSRGPFTVFAPTNAAFKKLPQETVKALLSEKGKSDLVGILKYHVVAGKVKAADVVKLKKATTVLGKDVSILVKGGKVMIGNAQVIVTDIPCENGVIHVIDTVLVPDSNE